MNALIVVDIQNDFLPGGALAVPNGDAIIPLVNSLLPQFDLIVATQDWHLENHGSFAANHPNKKPFDQIDLHGLDQTLWPIHCVQGTPGANFAEALNMNPVEAIFRKGMDPTIDSYSGFYDNGHKKATGMEAYLKGRDVNEVCVVGLAGDYCVAFTAQDALQMGFRTTIIKNATRPISAENFDKILSEFVQQGGQIAET